MPIQIDESQRPIVVVTFSGTASDTEFDAYLDAMSKRVLGRRERTVTILDATLSDQTPAGQRKRQAQWLERHADDLARYSLGTAFVIKSALVRGALTAIFWIQPIQGAHVVVGTLPEAETWARARLHDAGLA
jgi:hypothetical protein